MSDIVKCGLDLEVDIELTCDCEVFIDLNYEIKQRVEFLYSMLVACSRGQLISTSLLA